MQRVWRRELNATRLSGLRHPNKVAVKTFKGYFGLLQRPALELVGDFPREVWRRFSRGSGARRPETRVRGLKPHFNAQLTSDACTFNTQHIHVDIHSLTTRLLCLTVFRLLPLTSGIKDAHLVEAQIQPGIDLFHSPPAHPFTRL